MKVSIRRSKLVSVQVGPTQSALDDLRAGQAVVDVALAEGADDRFGVADQRRVVDDGTAVGGNRGGHGTQAARTAAAPLALADEVELVFRHPPDDTQRV